MHEEDVVNKASTSFPMKDQEEHMDEESLHISIQDQVPPHDSSEEEKHDEVIEDFVASPQEEHVNEESPQVHKEAPDDSMEGQGLEEDFVGERIKKDKGLVNYNPFQISEFHEEIADLEVYEQPSI
jgi:hypothetical protein